MGLDQISEWISYSYLSRTIFLAGAIILVNDDGVLNIDHADVLENDMLDKPIARSGP